MEVILTALKQGMYLSEVFRSAWYWYILICLFDRCHTRISAPIFQAVPQNESRQCLLPTKLAEGPESNPFIVGSHSSNVSTDRFLSTGSSLLSTNPSYTFPASSYDTFWKSFARPSQPSK
ncbi:hypothetical protein PHLGIDRAFT_320928 [Phlebiopsis gigantea 11061_1 CR5-6]|uniref:Uncharacterized protein n=1 Tax=Phlebiopsis gigantea (strain 11061_1 CR5-6) TaxID=745531 RepID=A0A0C3PAR1_PHLG1|nr:hypothetical protein PHLGIDRAFT_320928 [Phlebiopsis gigantea 11061_1 CR5-6]